MNNPIYAKGGVFDEAWRMVQRSGLEVVSISRPHGRWHVVGSYNGIWMIGSDMDLIEAANKVLVKFAEHKGH